MSTIFNDDPDLFAVTVHYARAGTGATNRDVYFGLNGLTPLSILHEALHVQTGLDDEALARKLGFAGKETADQGYSDRIIDALHANGCF